MKILFVIPRLPLPLDSGAKIRTFNLLKTVARDNQVMLLSFYFENNEMALEQLKNLGIQVHLVKAKEDINPFSIVSNKPISIEKYFSREVNNKLSNLVTANKFDVVHFDHLHMGQYRSCIDGVPSVLDEHNVESVILERCALVEKNALKKMLFKSQIKKMARFESRLVRQFTRCLTVSEADKQSLLKLAGVDVRVEVVQNGVDTEYFKPSAFRDSPLWGQSLDEDALVFTGSMDWLPNADAVIYFCKEVLPLIWNKKSEVKFYIVGKNPTKDVLRLAKQDKRIAVVGLVDDVRPYIANAKVFVVPLRIGGGTRLKILEAMAMGKATISTSIGAEGLEIEDEEHLLIADKPEDFAKKVVQLLEDNILRNVLGSKGRELVLEKYDWKIIGEKLNQIYREVVDNVE